MQENQKVAIKSTELKERIDTGELHESILDVFKGEGVKKCQMLLMVWKGSESSRSAMFTFSQSKGWVGQYDALVGHLRFMVERARIASFDPPNVSVPCDWVYETPKEFVLSDAIMKHICDHPEYKLPMMLVIWNPDDSVVCKTYFMNMSKAWIPQVEAIITHISQLSTYTKENVWTQQDYMAAQQRAIAERDEQQKRQREESLKPKLIVPR